MIEILVVLAIVAIVAAIMLPVIIRARQGSKVSMSISNMRQLHMAIELYRSDYDGASYGTLEDMGLPPVPGEKCLGSSVRDLRPPNNPLAEFYYYYPIPSAEDRRRPNWAQYSLERQGSTVLLADVWFNPREGRPPHPYYIMDPDVPKFLIGITLDGSIRRKTASGLLDLIWWDR